MQLEIASEPRMPVTRKSQMMELYSAYVEAPDELSKNRLRQEIVRFVERMTKKLVLKLQRQSTQHADLEDLLQAGRIGVMVALDRFDPTKGQFSTYAGWWIRDEVQKCLYASPVIYSPKGAGIPYQTMRRAAEIEAKAGRPATAEELETTEEQLQRWRQFPAFCSLSAVPVESGSDGPDCNGTTFTKDTASSDALVDELLTGIEDEEALLLAIDRLPEDEKFVVKQHYLNGKTFKELAKHYEVSPKVVGELCRLALDRLRGFLS